jgi:ABC-type transporter Mla subunit MlaD
MDSRVEMFLEDFDGLIESHSELVESLDAGDREIDAALSEIETILKPFAAQVSRIRRRASASDDEMDELEATIEELNDLFADLEAFV